MRAFWRALAIFLFGGVLGTGFGVALGFFLFPYVFPPPPANEQLTQADIAPLASAAPQAAPATAPQSAPLRQRRRTDPRRACTVATAPAPAPRAGCAGSSRDWNLHPCQSVRSDSLGQGKGQRL